MKTRRRKHTNAPPKICQKEKLDFEECEQAIMRAAVDEIDAFQQKNKVQNGPEIHKIMSIVEGFIRRKRLVLYGGQAINSILPRHAQFYGASDIPDYDFFTTNSPRDARELADEFYAAGYTDVEAKSGVHKGTQKVYVSNIPAADLTQQDPTIFAHLQKDAIVVDGIHYAPPNWLRMGMYLELCRTYGDTTRFEKVLKRLTLLNKYHPMKTPHGCHDIQFQRASTSAETAANAGEQIYDIVRNVFIQQNVVFFGGYAMSLYSQYMPAAQRRIVRKIGDFDVLSEDIDRVARIAVEQLKQGGFARATTTAHPPVGEVVPRSIEIRVGAETVAFLYEPDECVNYNEVSAAQNGAGASLGTVRVASIDTILRYYLAFLYTGRPYYDIERLLCMANFLFRVQQQNRLTQRGLLRRFTTTCIGQQHTLEDIRAEKAEEFKRLRGKQTDPEYEQWFLKYVPAEAKTPKKERDARAANTPKKEREAAPHPKRAKKKNKEATRDGVFRVSILI